MTRNKRINHVSIHTIGHGIHPVFYVVLFKRSGTTFNVT